jgi:hypothetical protein
VQASLHRRRVAGCLGKCQRIAQLAEEFRPVLVVEHSQPGQRAELGRSA